MTRRQYGGKHVWRAKQGAHDDARYDPNETGDPSLARVDLPGRTHESAPDESRGLTSFKTLDHSRLAQPLTPGIPKTNRPMKIKSLILVTFLLGTASLARAYNHKWLGAASGSWGIGQNWTNNFPNPTENRAMRLFFPSFSSEFNTIQDVDGLVVDSMDVSGPYHFNGGPGATLGVRDTNGLSGASVSLSLDDGPTFESDLTVILTMPVGVWAQGTAHPTAVSGYFNGPVAGPGEFHQYGTGRLEFGGSQANTYTGLTWVHSGNLQLNKTGAVAIRGGLVVGVEGGAWQRPARSRRPFANHRRPDDDWRTRFDRIGSAVAPGQCCGELAGRTGRDRGPAGAGLRPANVHGAEPVFERMPACDGANQR